MALKENILDRAQKYIAKGYFDKAIAEYRAAIELDPKDIAIRLRLGDLFVKLGNKAEAIKEYMEAAKANAQRGFNLKAIAVFKQVLKLDEANLDVRNRLAELYAKQRLIVDAIGEYTYIMGVFEKKGKTNDVIELLKKMAEIDAENAGIRLKLAEYYQRLGFDKDALAEYCGVFDKLFSQNKFDKAEKVILGLFSRYPGEVRALTRLTRLYKTRSDSSQFIRYSEMLLDYYKSAEDEEGVKAVCAEILEAAPDHHESLRLMERLSPRPPEPEEVAQPHEEAVVEKKAPLVEEPRPAAAEEAEESAPLIEFPEAVSEPQVSAPPLPPAEEPSAAAQAVKEEEEIEISLEGFEETMEAEPARLEERAPVETRPVEAGIEIKLEMEEAPQEALKEEAAPEPVPAAEEAGQAQPAPETVSEEAAEPQAQASLEAMAGVEAKVPLEAAVREAPVAEEGLIAQAPVPEEAAPSALPQEPKEEGFAEKEAEEALLAIEAMQAEEALKQEALPEPLPSEGVKEEAPPLLEEALLKPTEEATEAETLIEIQEEIQEAAAKEAEEEAEEEPPAIAIEERVAGEVLEQAVAPPAAEEEVRLEAEAPAAEEKEAPPLREDRVEKDISEAISELMEKMEPPPPPLDAFPEKVVVEAHEERKEDEFVDLSEELGIERGTEGFARPHPKPLEAADELLSGIEKQLGKEDTETHYNLGIAYMEMELYKEASNEFKVGLRDARLAFDCYMRLGLCAMAQSNPDEAIIYYLKALQIDSKAHEDIKDLRYKPSTGKEKLQLKSSISRRKGIMYELGLAYEAAAGYEEAAEVFKAIYDMDPEFRDVASKVQASAHSGEFIPADDDMIDVELL